MSEVNAISTKMAKARKQYRCDYSFKTIKIGDEYKREVNVYEGKIYTFRVCKEALYIIDKLDMYGRGTNNDGFTDVDYDDMLHDYIRENNLSEEFEDYTRSAHDFVYEYLVKKEVGR